MAIKHNTIWRSFESGCIVQNSYLKHRMDLVSIYVKWANGYAPSYHKDHWWSQSSVTACLSQLQKSDMTEGWFWTFKAQWSVYMWSQPQIITHRQAWICRLLASHWSYIFNLAGTSISKSPNTNFSATLFKYWFEGFESLFLCYNIISAVFRLM